MKNRDIIVVGIQAWDTKIGSNCKDIAATFAKNNRVLYVNPPLDRKTKLLDRKQIEIQKRINIIKGKEPSLSIIKENLWNLQPDKLIESINWLPSIKLFRVLNKRNNHIFAECIKQALKELNFTNYVIFNDSSMFLGYHLSEFLKPKSYMYYVRDNLRIHKYWKKHGGVIEPEIIKKSDVVTTNSIKYANDAKKYNTHSYMVGQGCDIEMYNDDIQTIEVAKELTEIKKPMIGYVGYLTHGRLDIDLIIYIAKSKPEWSIVLVGPENEVFKNSELHQMNNVYFLGSKPPETLPSFIKGFDICFNPQKLNVATMGNYPRKIDEYLALGKPTIATVTEAMEYFKDHTYLCKTHKDYIIAIDKALSEDNTELQKARKTFAHSHTWDNNVQAIYNAFDKIDK